MSPIWTFVYIILMSVLGFSSFAVGCALIERTIYLRSVSGDKS